MKSAFSFYNMPDEIKNMDGLTFNYKNEYEWHIQFKDGQFDDPTLISSEKSIIKNEKIGQELYKLLFELDIPSKSYYDSYGSKLVQLYNTTPYSETVFRFRKNLNDSPVEYFDTRTLKQATTRGRYFITKKSDRGWRASWYEEGDDYAEIVLNQASSAKRKYLIELLDL